MELFWWLIAGIAGAGVLLYWFQTKQEKAQEQALKSHFRRMKDFTPTQTIMGTGVFRSQGIAIDEGRQKVCLLTYEATSHPPGLVSRVISRNGIVSSVIVEDGSAVTRVDRGSQLGGAAVGGLLFGGLGAVVGGMSGTTETTTKVKQVSLHLIIDDTIRPVHEVTFMNYEDKKGGFHHRDAMVKARHWHGLLEVLIKRADSEAQTKQSIAQSSPPSSIADELRKLVDLRDSGVLDAEEFQRQKVKVLAK